MKLDLEPNEVQFLLQVLGELPTKTGAFVLVQKIEAQAASQQASPISDKPELTK
jgi:hypothetical protein